MSRWRTALAVLGAVLVLGAGNLTILQKQDVVENGRQVLLPLAPVDPRSLIQGDYMRLRFRETVFPDRDVVSTLPRRGTVVLALDENGVGRYARLDDGSPVQPDEIRLSYKVRGPYSDMRYSGRSFFFQEGHADSYGSAAFGVLRVDEDGTSILVGLADAEHQVIRPD